MMAPQVEPHPSLLVFDDFDRGIDEGRKVPVPMLPSEIVRIDTAMYFADVCDKTIREWSKHDGIGRQSTKNGTLQISLPALLMKVDGQKATLERLRAGDRSHPAVEFYLRRALLLMEEERTGVAKRRRDAVRAEVRAKNWHLVPSSSNTGKPAKMV